MGHRDSFDAGYAVMLKPHDRYWVWSVFDLEGETRAAGQDTDREAAWRSGLFAAGAIEALERTSTRRF